MRNKMISVIVPIYNVEEYLEKCIESILVQSYSNLEIILINDGSHDNCGRICDDYQRRDNRIRVIHQSNQGVSAARNAGLNTVLGDYIGFVDPDDWVEPDMYQHLIYLIAETGADIAQCGVFVDSGNRADPGGHSLKIIEGYEAIFEHAADGRISVVLWCNLYQASLWEGLRFSEGHCYEDAIVFPAIMQRCTRWVYSSRKLYHYNRRNSGIVRMEKDLTHLKSKEKAVEVYLQLYHGKPEYKQSAAFYLCGLIANYRWLVCPNSNIDRRKAKAHNLAMNKIFRHCFNDAVAACIYKKTSALKRLYWRIYNFSPLIARHLLKAFKENLC